MTILVAAAVDSLIGASPHGRAGWIGQRKALLFIAGGFAIV